MVEHTGKPRICFVAHLAYGALAGIDTGHIGGIERQMSLMARWLARQGYEVSMITWDEGQDDGVVIDGVRVFRMCREDAGLKGLRFFWPKWTSLRQALRRADADVYYYNCGDLGLGQVVMWCRRHGRRSVYSVASNPACAAGLAELGSFRERALYRYGLTRADSVIVQTHEQQQMLREGFGIASTVVPMPCEGLTPGDDHPPDLRPAEPAHVLWVGRISKEKRFEWLLDAAQRCPEICFDVVGSSNVNSDYASALVTRSAEVPNVKMHGRVLHADIANYFRQAHILCCTSAYEGFPNTFLEAWSIGIPVVSTFDPDGIVARHHLGWVVSGVEQTVDALKEAITDGEKWKSASASAREYYLRNHTLDHCMEQFIPILSHSGARHATAASAPRQEQ